MAAAASSGDPSSHLAHAVGLVERSPYEAVQYVQAFVARRRARLSEEEARGLVFGLAGPIASAAAAGVRGAAESAVKLVAWWLGDADRGDDRENHAAVLSFCDASPAAVGAPLLELLVKREVPGCRAKLGLALASLGDYPAACRNLSLTPDVQPYAATLEQWAALGPPSERALFGARAVLLLLRPGEAHKARALRAALEQRGLWDAEGQAACRLCDVLLRLHAAGPAVDKAAVFRHVEALYGPALARRDAELARALVVTGERLFRAQARGQHGAATAAAARTGSRGGGGAGRA